MMVGMDACQNHWTSWMGKKNFWPLLIELRRNELENMQTRSVRGNIEKSENDILRANHWQRMRMFLQQPSRTDMYAANSCCQQTSNATKSRARPAFAFLYLTSELVWSIVAARQSMK